MRCPLCNASASSQTPMYGVGFMPRGTVEAQELTRRLDDIEYSDESYTVCMNGHAIPTEEW